MEPKIITQTDDYFVINKPPGMAVEPPSNGKTLRDWLIENRHINPSDWQEGERDGVVHRLDTDTSGVMIWAKNRTAQAELKNLWQGRQTKKTYIGLVVGECQIDGTIELAIERDNKNDRMKVAWLTGGKARPAITTYKRLAVGEVVGEKVSLIEAHPVTGRTHQIRVHMKSAGHPIVGDKLYGEKVGESVAKNLAINRHFLHARELCLPWQGKEICYHAPLPEDLINCLTKTGIGLSTEIKNRIGVN